MEPNPKDWTREYYIANKSLCDNVLQQDQRVLHTLPLLNCTPKENLRDGQLVVYEGMLQDMLNPQIYMESCEFKDATTGNVYFKSGLYRNSIECLPNERVNYDSSSNKNSERQVCLLTSIPGLNSWEMLRRYGNLRENLETDESYEPSGKRVKLSEDAPQETQTPCDKCYIKVYEDGEALKLNQTHKVIGFLTLNDNSLEQPDSDGESNFVHWNQLPVLHVIKRQEITNRSFTPDEINQIGSKLQSTRSDLRIILNSLLFGDDLAVEYLICHLISSVQTRLNSLCLGTLPLNFSHFPLQRYKDFPAHFYDILSIILPKSCYFKCTLDELNRQTLLPRKDYESERLTTGALQLTDHTHLVIDETEMTHGTLFPTGRNNYEALRQLIMFQNIPYDFKYYSINYDTDVPVLILSEVKSFIPCSHQVRIISDSETENIYPEAVEAAKRYLTDSARLNDIRGYLEYMRQQQCELDQQVSEVIQSDFVQKRQEDKNFNQDSMHSVMVLAKLLSLSYGSKFLTVEHWKRAMEMETERVQRLKK